MRGRGTPSSRALRDVFAGANDQQPLEVETAQPVQFGRFLAVFVILRREAILFAIPVIYLRLKLPAAAVTTPFAVGGAGQKS